MNFHKAQRIAAMTNKLTIAEVRGNEIVIPLTAHTRTQIPEEIIKDLKEELMRKNATIERQTDYISDLQEENSRLLRQIRMLSI